MGEDIQKVIKELSPIQKKILIRFAKLGAGTHCNVRLETVQKRLLKEERNHIGNEIQILIAKKLIFTYRSRNYGLTTYGKAVAHALLEKEKEELYGFRII